MGSGTCLSDATITGFWAGELPQAALAEVDNHVDACPACSLLLSEAFSTRKSARALAYGANRRPHTFRPQMVIGGRYRIRDFLGAGGMGEVYAADDLTLGEGIALKTVNAAISDDPQAIARLKAEVQLARRVTHRNVCRIFDFGVHEDFAFLTMELLAGETLAKRLLRMPPFDLVESLRLGRQIALGLEAAHQVGVIHRDLKPDNVIILADSSSMGGRPVVTDFGLARMMFGDDPHAGGLTLGSRTLSGTPGYIAPERTRGQAASAASDIFALGVIMREMVFGFQPSPATSDPTGANSVALPEASLISGPQVNAVRALIDRCAAFAPEDRPANSTAVVLEIDALLSGADRAGANLAAASPPAAVKRARRVAALAISSLTAAALVVVGALVLSGRDAPPLSSLPPALSAGSPPPSPAVLDPRSLPSVQPIAAALVAPRPAPATAAVPAPPGRSQPGRPRLTLRRLASRPGHETSNVSAESGAPVPPPVSDDPSPPAPPAPPTPPMPGVSTPPLEDAPIRLRKDAQPPGADDAPIRPRH